MSVSAHTSDLSLVGCYIDTLNPLPSGTAIKMRIAHDDETFFTFGTVVYSKSNMGMGIKFLKVEHNQSEVLRGWLNKLNGGDP
ncbi:MAG: PilZ domain-containing protein [Candidatus Acidiferrales bacterium]